MDKIVLEGRWIWDDEDDSWYYLVNDHYICRFCDIVTVSADDRNAVYSMADTLVQQLDPLGRITIKHPAELPVFSEVAE